MASIVVEPAAKTSVQCDSKEIPDNVDFFNVSLINLQLLIFFAFCFWSCNSRNDSYYGLNFCNYLFFLIYLITERFSI